MGKASFGIITNSMYIPIVSIALCTPCAIDIIRRYFLRLKSTNTRRVLTGIPAGIGLGFLTIYLMHL